MLGYKKGNTKLLTGQIPLHYPADRVYLDGDTTKTVQDKCARKADLTNLDLTGTTNTTGSTIASGTYFYLNETLVRAKTAIANGATFTLNTNYEVVSKGGLNDILSTIPKYTDVTYTNVAVTSNSYTLLGEYPTNAIMASVRGGNFNNVNSAKMVILDSNGNAYLHNGSDSGTLTTIIVRYLLK